MKIPFPAILVLILLSMGVIFAQSPNPEPIDKVITEEIRIGISALDRNGDGIRDLQKDDIVISEDGRLHQASSVRDTIPSVLLAMDTGGTIRQKKNIGTTRSVASALVSELKPGAYISVIQFHDRVERLSSWTSDKSTILTSVDTKTSFGRRSTFTSGIREAGIILAKAPTDNRHLVLITDGLDTIEDAVARSTAIRDLWQSGVMVHVVSYTGMEIRSQQVLGGLLENGNPNPRRMPEQVLEELIYAIPVKKTIARDILRQIYQPRLLSIIVDQPFLRAQKDQAKNLATAQLQLSVLAEYTGGEFLVPEKLDEMTEHGRQIARNINSQYIITYAPKRPLKEVVSDEIRHIEASSRRPGVEVRASRRLVVFGTGETK